MSKCRMNERRKQLYRVLFGAFMCFLVSLGSIQAQGKKFVRFNVDKPDLISTSSLAGFLDARESPKIVVRYSTFEVDRSQYDLDYIYNIIEKEFLKGNYSVKDRVLFDEVINRSEDLLDYELIKEKTDTELIFEIVKLETDLDYITDSYFNNKGIKTVLYKDGEVHVVGARVEFKLIIVEKNELAGNYVFNYAPCSSGCPIRLRDYEVVFEDDFGEKLPANTYKSFTQEQLEDFVKDSVAKLINHLDGLNHVADK